MVFNFHAYGEFFFRFSLNPSFSIDMRSLINDSGNGPLHKGQRRTQEERLLKCFAKLLEANLLHHRSQQNARTRQVTRFVSRNSKDLRQNPASVKLQGHAQHARVGEKLPFWVKQCHFFVRVS